VIARCVGAGREPEAGSFRSRSGSPIQSLLWIRSCLRRDESGLIDDIKIYDRAVTP